MDEPFLFLTENNDAGQHLNPILKCLTISLQIASLVFAILGARRKAWNYVTISQKNKILKLFLFLSPHLHQVIETKPRVVFDLNLSAYKKEWAGYDAQYMFKLSINLITE